MFSKLFGASPKAAPVAANTNTKPVLKVVARPGLDLLKQRGWTVSGNTFEGPYVGPRGTYRGHITRAGDVWRVLILNPPAAKMQNHPKRACFHPEGQGWLRIHLHTPPKDNDVNSIILYVEKVLRESEALG